MMPMRTFNVIQIRSLVTVPTKIYTQNRTGAVLQTWPLIQRTKKSANLKKIVIDTYNYIIFQFRHINYQLFIFAVLYCLT